MNKKILHNEVGYLQTAKMEFPTWDLFKNLIVEVKQRDFPMQELGSSPMACPDKTLIPVSGTPQLKSIIGGNVFVGIDVPVLLSPKDRGMGKTIIIVGESPLRNTKDFKNSTDILLGTPYAIHQEFGCPPQCNVYKKIFSNLLAEGYSIYLTDAIKVWWKNKKKQPEQYNSNILEQELCRFPNATIVTFGNTAKNAINSISPQKSFCDLLHPSQLNWNNWKLHIFEKAIYEKKDINYATDLFPNKEESISEVIVANEAVKEILEYCSKTNI